VDAESDPDPHRQHRAACAAAYRDHYTRLVRFAEKHTGDLDVAKDIVSDVFCDLLCHGDASTVRTTYKNYLYITVGFAIATWRRTIHTRAHAASDQRGPPLPRDIPADEPAQLRDLADRSRRAIAALPPRSRLIYHLLRVEGHTREQVAETLALSMSELRTHVEVIEHDISAALTGWRNI
jgi:RNA polymerase sigma-70 factor (ECF subfamily)